MDRQDKRPLLPVRLAVFIALHLAVLALAWAMAALVSKSHEDLPANGGRMRLVPIESVR